MIKEVIVVEGKDDISAVKAALDCEVIATSGFGYGKKLINTLKRIEKRCGLIIFTDPDYMGKKIRRDLAKNIPTAKHAFLPRNKALKGDNVGVENANVEDIKEAIKNAKASLVETKETFKREELFALGLIMGPDAATKRTQISNKLGIGHGNAKQFLKRLNSFGIEREEFEKALKEVEDGKTL